MCSIIHYEQKQNRGGALAFFFLLYGQISTFKSGSSLIIAIWVKKSNVFKIGPVIEPEKLLVHGSLVEPLEPMIWGGGELSSEGEGGFVGEGATSDRPVANDSGLVLMTMEGSRAAVQGGCRKDGVVLILGEKNS